MPSILTQNIGSAAGQFTTPAQPQLHARDNSQNSREQMMANSQRAAEAATMGYRREEKQSVQIPKRTEAPYCPDSLLRKGKTKQSPSEVQEDLNPAKEDTNIDVEA